MYNPIIEQLKIAYVQLKRALVHMLYWHSFNHGMYVDLYINQTPPSGIIECVKMDLKYLKEKNAPMSAKIDYYIGQFRQILLSIVLICLLIAYITRKGL